MPEKNEILNDIRNAEGESNEHKNQNKSPRTSAMEDDTTTATSTREMKKKKNVLLFCSPSSIALPAIRFPYLRWYEKSFVVLWELWYSFWQSKTGMLKKMRAEYISTEWKAAARTFIARSGYVYAEDRSYAAEPASTSKSTRAYSQKRCSESQLGIRIYIQ